MESISNNLKDPAWWFTVVFVGIIIAVVSGYAKDRFDRLLGSLSARNRERQVKKAEHRKEVVTALADNEGLLILSMIRVGLALFISFVC